MKKWLLLYLFIAPIEIYAQKEDYNWIIGNRLVNFNYSPPKIDSFAFTIGGAIADIDQIGISDSLGNINAITGNDGCLQDSNLIDYSNCNGFYNEINDWSPFLNHPNENIIFNFRYIGSGSFGTYYSYINTKNRTYFNQDSLLNSENRRITEVVGTDTCNSLFYYSGKWQKDTLQFSSYKINSNGVNPSPVQSIVNTLGLTQNNFIYKGYSENGKLLVLGNRDSKQTLTMVFLKVDNNKGTVSLQGITSTGLFINSSFSFVTAAQFDLNNSFLYFYAQVDTLSPTGIFRLNMGTGKIDTILPYMSYPYSNNHVISMSLAPDNSILFLGRSVGRTSLINNNQDTVYQITNPSELNISKLNLQILLGGISKSVFPYFPKNYFSRKDNSRILENIPCFPDTVTFSKENVCIGTTLFWHFGDLLNPPSDTASGLFVKHKYSAPGFYTLKIISKGILGTDTFYRQIFIPSSPANFNLGRDTNLLCNNPIKLGIPTSYGYSYQWQNGVNASSIFTTTPGNYTLKVSNSCGIASDSIKITYSNPPLNLKNAMVPCYQPATFDGGIFDSHIWSSGDTARFLVVTSPGTYWVKSTNSCGNVIDTVSIAWKSPQPLPIHLVSGIISVGDSCISNPITLSLTDTIGVTHADWQLDSFDTVSKQTPFIYTLSLTSPGTYFVSVKASHFCYADSSFRSIHVDTKPFVYLGNDTTIVCGSEVILNGGPNYKSYRWQDGSTLQTTTVRGKGIYYVQVTNNCGSASDSLTVDIKQTTAPNIFTPNGDGKNEEFIFGEYQVGSGLLSISNRWGESVFETNSYNNDWKAENTPDGIYYFNMDTGCQKLRGWVQVMR